MPSPESAARAAHAWHWPSFAQALCGSESDRERLGLPDRYQRDRWPENWSQVFLQLCAEGPDAWLAAVESATAALETRHAAGQLLALAGDPRIVAEHPAMIEIRGGSTAIGLDFAEVDRVMAELSGLGLKREWILKECPRHTVKLAPFRIARFPVTNAEYLLFLECTGYPEIPSSWTFRRFPRERSNHPVYTLSAAACEAYARWLSRQTGRRFRLPSEAEWEFAAAGQDGRRYPWGERFDADCANTAETGIFDTTAVGSFPAGASAFGLLDMAGNVEEYVADDYAPYPGGQLVDDHLRQIHGQYRVARGGCFARFRDLARTRRRHGFNPRSSAYAMGFRLAESP